MQKIAAFGLSALLLVGCEAPALRSGDRIPAVDIFPAALILRYYSDSSVPRAQEWYQPQLQQPDAGERFETAEDDFRG